MQPLMYCDYVLGIIEVCGNDCESDCLQNKTFPTALLRSSVSYLLKKLSFITLDNAEVTQQPSSASGIFIVTMWYEVEMYSPALENCIRDLKSSQNNLVLTDTLADLGA